MKTMGMLFSSAAKTELLRALVYQPEPIGLRNAARLAGVHPHSAEGALAELGRQGLVRRDSSTLHPLYELVRSRDEVPMLEAVFAAAAQGYIRERSRALNERAKSILPFIRQGGAMIARSRRPPRVT